MRRLAGKRLTSGSLKRRGSTDAIREAKMKPGEGKRPAVGGGGEGVKENSKHRQLRNRK